MLALSFKRYQPLGLRLWHWFNAAVITGLLLTVALRKLFFGVRANAQWIQAKALAAGTPLAPTTAIGIAREWQKQLWAFHIYLGYALAALLIIRLAVAMIHGESAWGHFKRSLKQFRSTHTPERGEARHYFLVRSLYLSFYMAVGFMVLSGLFLVFKENLDPEGLWAESVHEVHEFFQWYFIVFIAAHMIGVIRAELGKHKGIVSAMLHGGQR